MEFNNVLVLLVGGLYKQTQDTQARLILRLIATLSNDISKTMKVAHLERLVLVIKAIPPPLDPERGNK